MSDGEIKGRKFLEYVAKNEKQLKKNLKKNITFENSLFDDIFQDTIIKVYNTIVKNNKEIDDYEQYFFISSKWNFILKQNYEREMVKKRVNIDKFIEHNDVVDEPYSEIETSCLLNEIRDIIEDEFGFENTELYYQYMSLKSNGGMSYTRFSEITGVPYSKISEIVCRIKGFVKNNDKINRIKHALDR